jgi:hypothetical protein
MLVAFAILAGGASGPVRSHALFQPDRGPTGQPAGELADAELVKLHKLIKPLPGEMAWRTEIQWLTSIQEAREKAAAEGKPILIWITADGHPLGAT